MLKSNSLQNSIKILSIIAIIVLGGIGIFVYHADVPQLIIFALFILFYVQLPGHLILRMLRIKLNHISTTLIMSLFTGWAFSLAMYFITELIHTNLLLYAAGPVLSFLYVLARYLNRTCDPKINFSFSKLSTALFIFLVLAFAYAMLNTQYLYISADIDNEIYMNPDKAYHLGLINSLAHGWPLQLPWVQGYTVNYHVFTEMLFAIPVRLFGLTSYSVLLSCGPYLTIYAFGLSLYSLFREMTVKSQRAGLYCLALMLSNIFIAKTEFSSLAFFFIFRNENATGYGVSCMMVCLIMFKYWYERFDKGDRSLPHLLVLTALIMLATGIKGPMGMVVIMAIWATVFLGFILRRGVKFKTFLPLIIMTVGFIIIYVTILGSKGQSNGGGTSIIAFAKITDVMYFKSGLTAALKSMGLPKIVRLGAMFIAFMVFMLTAFFLPFAIGYVRELFLVFSKKKDYDVPRVLVYAASLAGLVAVFVLNYSGHSQVYFGYVCVFLAPLISFWLFEDLEEKKSVLLKPLAGFFIISLLLTTFTLGWYYVDQETDAVKEANMESKHSIYQSMNHGEYEAMIWISKNTPYDSLLAVDRYYSVPLDKYSFGNRWDNRFFLYSDYANRFTYISGSGYNVPVSEAEEVRKYMVGKNMELYDVNNADRGEDAHKLGVDYVVVSKRFTKLPNLENKDYELCFTNNDVDVYEVK